MFSRSKKQAQVPYIEGTQGRYVKRLSPPPVPSLTSHNLARRNTTQLDTNANPTVAASTTTTANDVIIARSSSSMTPTSKFINGNSEMGVRKPSASAMSITSTEYSPVSHSPAHERHILVHQNVNKPATEVGSTSHLPTGEHHLVVLEDGMSLNASGQRSPVPGALSSHSFSDSSRREHRKVLTTSHSIGNVESFMNNVDLRSPLIAPQQRFVSLQSLPGRPYGGSVVGEDLVDDLPLPPNWAVEYTAEGLIYYVDHLNRRTHWIHPLAQEHLPPGWNKHFTPHTGVIYYNQLDGRTQVEHPGVAHAAVSRAESMLLGGGRRTESTVEHLNIIQQEEVPEWLLMYSQADNDLDHLLEWNMFNTMQIEQYEYMMRKLYKQEVIDTVRRYERMRAVLKREIARRTEPRPPPDLAQT